MSQHVFHKEPTTLKTGHFTQIVWRESRELGVGMARNRAGEVFIVANYDPPGNYIGSFKKNVLPLVNENVDRLSEEKSFKDTLEDKRLDEEAFALNILKHHNEYRRKHQAPDLM